MQVSPFLTFRRGDIDVPVVPSDYVAVAFVPGTSADRVQEIVTAVSAELDAELSTELQELGLTERYTHRVLMPPGSDEAAVSHAFSSRSEVQFVGPLVVDPNARPLVYLTDELLLGVEEPARTAEALGRARELGFEVLRRVPYATPETYHLRATVHPGYRLLDLARELMRIDGVRAEPNLGGTVEPYSNGVDPAAASSTQPGTGAQPGTGTQPGTSTGADLWDRRQVGVEPAWARLRQAQRPSPAGSGLVLAVVDGSLDADHPRLPSYRRVNFRDFRGGEAAAHLFSGTARGHGMRVAGVAAANGPEPGVAPGCRVLGLIYPATEADVLDMYAWAAGLDPWSMRPGFPPPLEGPKSGGGSAKGATHEAASVIVTSVGFGFAWGLPISALAASAFDHIAAHGRGGQGSLLFFAAGNGGTRMPYQCPWAAHRANFGVAASTLDMAGGEVRATYSNFQQVELCAPSSATLASNPEGWQQRVRTITSADRRGDQAQHAPDGGDDFGGTSSSAPLAAGVAALVLSARPGLRHAEARALLRGSAQRIDANAKNAASVWRTSDGKPAENVPPAGQQSKVPLSSWAYGFGRVDALQAVTDALAGRPGSADALASAPRAATPGAGTLGAGTSGAGTGGAGTRGAGTLGAGTLGSVTLGSRASTGTIGTTGRQGDGGWARWSVLLGLYHLALAFFLLLWLWPAEDAYRLAGVSGLLAIYHLLVALILRTRRGRPDVPSEEDPRLMSPDPRTQGS